MSAVEVVRSRAPAWAIDRLPRLARFGAVGASGFGVDVAVVAGAEQLGAGWFLASALAWFIATSSNFTLNWSWTWGRPAGIARRYIGYVAGAVVPFVIRVGIVGGLVELLDAALLVATVVGIAMGSAVWFVACELVVFQEADR